MQEVHEDTKAALLNYTVTEDKKGTTTIKIRMNNKLSALEKIARHIKFYDAEHPMCDVNYWIVDGPGLDEHDRVDDESFVKKETEQEAEVNRRIAEAKEQAIAETEERLKAEFALKLKKVKKAAKEKMKNTHEYPPLGEKQEARIKMQEGGKIAVGEQGTRNKEQGQEVGLEQGTKNKEQGQVVSIVAPEVKVIGDREGQYTPEGYLIKHDNPNRDINSPYYNPYSGLYIEKKVGNNMIVKSYLPSNKRWSRKEEMEKAKAC